MSSLPALGDEIIPDHAHSFPRSAAVWSADRRVVIPLVVLTLVHWALTIAGTHFFVSHANSVTDILHIPAIVPSLELHSTSNIKILFFFTTTFEIVIFALTFGKLFFPRRTRTQFTQRILEDGVLYFIVVYVFLQSPCSFRSRADILYRV